MDLFIKCLLVIVIAEHLGFMWLEMFAWETVGRRVFKGAMPGEMFPATRAMAANQGLYNGFLAAGLIWTFFISDIQWQLLIQLFFLSCVSVAGIYGAYSVSVKIFFIQAIPALITIALILMNP